MSFSRQCWSECSSALWLARGADRSTKQRIEVCSWIARARQCRSMKGNGCGIASKRRRCRNPKPMIRGRVSLRSERINATPYKRVLMRCMPGTARVTFKKFATNSIGGTRFHTRRPIRRHARASRSGTIFRGTTLTISKESASKKSN